MFVLTPNTFAGVAPPWSLTNLDANFTAIKNSMASANTFSNYAADTGAANAYVISLGAGSAATLAAGLFVQFKATSANTGASTLNVNATGVNNIVNRDGSALVANQILAGSIATVMYDGTSYELLSVNVVTASGKFLTVSNSLTLAGTDGTTMTFPSTSATISDDTTYSAPSTACTGALTNSIVWTLAKSGHMVTMHIPNIIGTPTNVTSIALGAAIPAAYRPPIELNFNSAAVYINAVGVAQPGNIDVNPSTGVVTIYRDASTATGWGTAGSSGILATAISWRI